MIDNLHDLTIFTRVVALGSLTRAARELHLSLAVVSKRLGALEDRLGMRLVQRTTRKQTLTQEGSHFHSHAIRILAEVQDAESAILNNRETVAGVLRITAPRAFGRHYVAPIVAEFQAGHPKLQVHLFFTDEPVDLVAQSLDVALRFGALSDSTMMARFISPNYRVLCAAPRYIARCGAPAHPSELKNHQCIVYGARAAKHWLFQEDGIPIVAEPNPTFVCNDGETGHALALAGAGVFFKSVWEVGDDLASGALVQVMHGYSAPSEPLHIVYPHAFHRAPRVRQFADLALTRLRDRWQW